MKTYKEVTPEQIDKLIDIAAQEYEANVYDIITGKRTSNVVDAKRSIYFILKTEFYYSEHYMVNVLPFKVHRTTIMYLNETTDFFLNYDYEFSVRYKNVYERFTKLQYKRPIPSKDNISVDKKFKPLYSYYTDDMIVKLGISAREKVKYLSNDFKDEVKLMAKQEFTYYRIQKDMGCSKKVVDLILSE